MEFKLPDIGEGIAEGEIVKWLVKEGEIVTEDQPVIQVMTDKATVEIQSPRSGRIAKRMVAEGEVVAVGSVLLVIEEGASGPGAAGSASTAKVEAPASASRAAVPLRPPASTAAPPPGVAGAPAHVLATPAIRKLARDLQVDLAFLRGTGPSGRITSEDVRRASSARQAVDRAAVAPTAPPREEREERLPFRGIRRRTAERMVQSSQTIPHYTYMDDVDVTDLVALRQRLKPQAEKQGTRLTYLPFIVRSVVDGLRRFPRLNASVDDTTHEIVLKRYYNIGIATSTPEGLIVPVVKDADRLTLFGIAQEIERLATAARSGRIQLQDLQGGTFTITNVGSHGGLFATPIINHPEVAILATHKIDRCPSVCDNQIAIRDVMHLSISLDHRVVDGAEAVEFMNHVIRLLESPQGLVG